jgi:polysaccharide biosynthesis/export protein
VKRLIYLLFFGAIVLSSCSSYKQNIMFRTGDYSKLSQEKKRAESNYVIQKNDILELEVFTNQGEKIIDPNQESFKQSPTASMVVTKPQYLVDNQGITKLPLLDQIKLEGLTIRQAEEILQKEYTRLYQDPYAVLRVINKRVTVLGAPGGKVIPLVNENIRLTEVLAMAGGINIDGKASNIRVLRGEEIFVADFSTIEGYLRDDILIQSGDIVYVEPVRRPFVEALQSYLPIASLAVSIATVVIILTRN